MNIEKIKSTDELWSPNLTLWEEVYWSLWRLWDKAYWYVHNNLFPNHKSIRKAIPKSWSDLDNITENVLSSIIVSFVEEEKGLDQIEMMEASLKKNDEGIKKDWGSVEYFWNYYETRYPDYIRLREIYNWVKTGKKGMENYMESVSDKNNWVEYTRVEQEIYDRDSEYLADLVKLRKYLWT
jgi:hypothetical protein